MRDGGIRIWTGRLDRGSGGSGPDPRNLAGDDGDGQTWRRPRRSAVEEDAGLAKVAPGADPATQGGRSGATPAKGGADGKEARRGGEGSRRCMAAAGAAQEAARAGAMPCGSGRRRTGPGGPRSGSRARGGEARGAGMRGGGQLDEDGGLLTWRLAIGRREVEGGHVRRRGFLSGGAR